MGNNLNAANILEQRGGEILAAVLLDKARAKFDRTEKNELKFTKEAAHSIARIIYKGDFTGKEIQLSLLNYLNDSEKFKNVKLPAMVASAIMFEIICLISVYRNK